MKRILSAILCFFFFNAPAAVAPEPQYAALTFDDGPSGHFTQNLLDGLDARGVKATFLLCGYRVKEFPEITRRIAESGHEIGNHGFSHKNMQTLGRREIAREIMDMQDQLPENTRVTFLRPPGGCCSEGVKQVAEARQLAILKWSVDPRDWDTGDSGAVTRYVVKNVTDGDIILLHDMSDSSVQAALDIIDQLTAKGFQFVTVSELARIRNMHILPGKTYSCFPPKTPSA